MSSFQAMVLFFGSIDTKNIFKRWITRFSRTKNLISEDKFFPASTIMMLDFTRASKWDPVSEGPFTFERKNKGGAYILQESW